MIALAPYILINDDELWHAYLTVDRTLSRKGRKNKEFKIVALQGEKGTFALVHTHCIMVLGVEPLNVTSELIALYLKQYGELVSAFTKYYETHYVTKLDVSFGCLRIESADAEDLCMQSTHQL